MTRNDYLKSAFNLYNEGKIDGKTYDTMICNIEDFTEDDIILLNLSKDYSEWCKNWIIKTFDNLPTGIKGIKVNDFWKLAEKSKIWVRGTYCTYLVEALLELTEVESISYNGDFLYNVYKLK